MSAYIHIISCSDVLNKNLHCAIVLFFSYGLANKDQKL